MKQIVMEKWIARNLNNHKLYLYDVEPERCSRHFDSKACYAHEIDNGLFPEVTWENSPMKIELKLIEQ